MSNTIRRQLANINISLRKSLKRYQRELSNHKISKDMLCGDLNNLGVVGGDTVFLHSSLRSIGYVSGGAKTVIEALKEAIAPNGNLIVPTYYLPGGTIIAASRQASTYCFDPDFHGTVLGAIPSAFLDSEGIRRSLHPTHSVSAFGPDAEYIVSDHHRAGSACGIDTPWGRLVELDGKILGIGISIAPVTFYHYLEDVAGEEFPEDLWLDPVDFSCKGIDGNRITVPVRPYRSSVNARRLEKSDRADLRSFLWEDFFKHGLINKGFIGKADSWCMNACDLYERLKTLMAMGITIYTDKETLASYIDRFE